METHPHIAYAKCGASAHGTGSTTAMTRAFDLTARHALVTGGNGGIGLGLADALAEAGANVTIWGRDEGKNADAATRLRAHGTGILALRCDVADEHEVASAMAQTLEQHGDLHACFANAGIGGTATPYVELSTEEWHRVLAVNLDGFFFTTRAAIANMVTHGQGGSVVAISSLAALEGQARGQHYAATKGAMVSMIRAIAVEHARYGIRANAILPGWIETDMTAGMLELEAVQEKVLKRVPVRRWGRPADLGGLAVYLASDASAYHTGDTFVVDGGYSVY